MSIIGYPPDFSTYIYYRVSHDTGHLEILAKSKAFYTGWFFLTCAVCSGLREEDRHLWTLVMLGAAGGRRARSHPLLERQGGWSGGDTKTETRKENGVGA